MNNVLPARRSLRPALLLVLLGLVALAPVHAGVVISQVYGGGGNSGAPFTHDFVELFNRGTAPAELGGLSLQYTSATGTGNFGANSGLIVALPAVELEPGQYFLIQLAGGSNGSPLPPADATGTINMAAGAGKVALATGTTSLGCNGGSTPCSAAQLARIVDLVGFGNANFFEGSAAAPTLSNTTAAHRAGGGCIDSDDNSNDFTAAAPAPRTSASPRAVCGGPLPPMLVIEDVALAEGDSGLTPFAFVIRLTRAAEVDVSVDVATRDGTATLADDDYHARAERITLPAGSTEFLFVVHVVGDTRFEADETFFVTLSNADGALIARDEATGLIINDDRAPTLPISVIQGAGIGQSPFLGQRVAIEGIVTARRANGYFVQSAPGEEDGDPTTAEGLFVFTGAAANMPAGAVVGNRVHVEATVTQFARTPHGLAMTQLGNASLTVVAENQPLPAEITLSDDDLSPEAVITRLGRYQAMRVRVPAARVTGASNRFGDLYVTLADVARPFREPGIALLDAVPLPPELDLPRFDMNPERLRIESTALDGSSALNVDAGSLLDGLAGVMYYDRGDFTLLLDPAAPLSVNGGPLPQPAAPRPRDAIAIAGFNIEHLQGGDAVPAHRLQKLSSVFCDYLGTPEIVGLVEIYDIETAARVARAINDNEFGHCQENPHYQAFLLSDRGTQHLAYLVSTREVRPGVPRVEVIEVAQEGVEDWLIMPDGGSTSRLFDRPPLRLTAIVHDERGRSYPLTVINNHLLSLLDVNSLTTRNDSWVTVGNRSRHKRMQQAVRLAEMIEARQQANPAEPIILVGDYNAFEFSDGYVDVMGILSGQPAAENEVLVWADTPLSRPLLNLAFTVPASQRYSYVFEGNAQVLDHILVNGALLDSASVQMQWLRLNADFATDNAEDPTVPVRSSDHDPALAWVVPAVFAQRDVDLQLAAHGPHAPIVAGRSGEFTFELANVGADPATDVVLVIDVDAAAEAVRVMPTIDWACLVSATGADRAQIECAANDDLAAHARAAVTVSVTPHRTAPQTWLTLVGEASASGTDANPADNRAEVRARVTGRPGG